MKCLIKAFYRSSNKQEAAALARDLYVQSRKVGWQAAIASHRAGEGRRRGEEITVGDLLKEFDRVSTAAPETRRDYKRALRRIVAGIRRLDGGKKKYGKRGSEELRAKADATPLRTITPESPCRCKKRGSRREVHLFSESSENLELNGSRYQIIGDIAITAKFLQGWGKVSFPWA